MRAAGKKFFKPRIFLTIFVFMLFPTFFIRELDCPFSLVCILPELPKNIHYSSCIMPI